ncbi:hypothetical protein [Sulfitobacter sp. S190]|uniref:hypothetical protein n=1 Tax=Sulfitobacter sp. S190 TaxID=2867022 RepID=UPI0021A86E97|nr:hypothetical protein [Sulfitobacter sp. S190]UWR21983.1 hypothetical protein K3756_15055 [Sulfitobacter sp. S190]
MLISSIGPFTRPSPSDQSAKPAEPERSKDSKADPEPETTTTAPRDNSGASRTDTAAPREAPVSRSPVTQSAVTAQMEDTSFDDSAEARMRRFAEWSLQSSRNETLIAAIAPAQAEAQAAPTTPVDRRV